MTKLQIYTRIIRDESLAKFELCQARKRIERERERERERESISLILIGFEYILGTSVWALVYLHRNIATTCTEIVE